MKPLLAATAVFFAVLYYGERQTTRQLREDARHDVLALGACEHAKEQINQAWQAAYEKNDKAWQDLYEKANEDWADSMSRLMGGESLEYRPGQAWEI